MAVARRRHGFRLIGKQRTGEAIQPILAVLAAPRDAAAVTYFLSGEYDVFSGTDVLARRPYPTTSYFGFGSRFFG